MTDIITLTVNGVEHKVGPEVSSDVMLVDYLRDHLQLRGTKYMCREGGCGACTITASTGDGEPSVAINSCLINITQCEGWSITTIEGLGNKLTGYNKIQKALCNYNGTQCGYCSPGWVMAVHGLLNLKTEAKMLDIEKGLSSNICRCTGYRPILDAFKTLATDASDEVRIRDIEELNICKKTGKGCDKTSCEEDDWCVVTQKDLKDSVTKKIVLKDGKIWYRPALLADLLKLMQSLRTTDYMLVGGNTAKGVSPIDQCPSIMIDINAIAELKVAELDQNLILGAGLTLTKFMSLLETYSAKDNFAYLTKVHYHVEKIAHITVRNVGTVGGNLMIKHKTNSFQSDLYLILETVGAQMTIVDKTRTSQIVTMKEFLALDMQAKVIKNILLPPLNETEYHIVSYKIMPRSQSTHAIVNAGFLYKLSTDNVVQECRMVYGALSESFSRASNTEKYLVGKSLFTDTTLQGAIAVLDAELVIVDHPPEPSVEFRRFLAKSLFYKGLMSLCPKSSLSTIYQSGALNIHDERGLSSGTQSYPTDTSKSPLGDAVGKLEGMIQCSGEAQYTEDIPSMHNEVFGAFALSTVAVGTIDSIDSTAALKLDGVVAVYTAADIPGLNSFTPSDDFLYSKDEPVLADGKVTYYYQPIAIVVATSLAVANRAAKLVTATYSNTKTPVVDIKEAVKDSTRNTLYTSIAATSTGTDVTKTITGSQALYGQYHMSMETNVCVAKPTDDGIELHSATQWPDGTQIMISRATNLPQNQIEVHVRRVGGSFGMKISRSIMPAVACALVVQKLNRPCRFILPMTTNTRALGKRMPCVNDYSVSVNASGVIQSIDYTIYEDNGYTTNETITALGVDVYNNCYDVTKFNYKAYDTITDTAKNTWCRSPGTFESITFMEMIMERICYVMGLDPIEVRKANLDTSNYGRLSDMITDLKTKADYTTRRAEVDTFNKNNRWRKRGLRINFCRWSPAAYLKYDVNISIFHADASICITHSAVEMGQGINTKAAQMAAYFLGAPLSKICIKPINTTSSPNAAICGGSLGTQTVLIALKRACEQMNTRLAPVKAMLKMPNHLTLESTAWETLITTAFSNDIDLQAHGYAGSADILTYNVYGMACAEVEVDFLTGEIEIHRLDMIQDVGFCLNSNIDIGQIEGAMAMGIGYFTSEKCEYDKTTGEILTERSWDIHVPQVRDIAKVTNIHILENSSGVETVLGSKGTGEPAMCSSVVIPLAIREAISQARLEKGIATTEWFDIDGPYSNEKICLNAKTTTADFKFST